MKMLYDTLYDIAGNTSCSWRFYVFLVDFFLLSEISSLAPRIGWSESLKQEKLKSGVFFSLLSSFTWPWHTSRWPAGCLRKLQISHRIAYFYHALHKVPFFFQVKFLVFHSMLFFILISGENKFQNFRLLSQTKILNFDQLVIQKNS